MNDANAFVRIFGDHRSRSTHGGRLAIRDDAFIADLRARVSGLAAEQNRLKNSGWLIAFSPVRTDDLTERSMFDATLTSAAEGERRLAFSIGRDWVQIGGGAMESSVRSNPDNLQRALVSAFRRVVLRWPNGTLDPAKVRMADA